MNNETTGSPHTSNNKEELTKKERQQQVTIELLLERVVDLEIRVKVLESELSITKTTSGRLKIMLNNQQQHSRRPCMVVSGMEAPGDKVSNSGNAENILSVLVTERGVDKNIIANNIGKFHSIGAVLDNKQQRIIKFKSNSFKEKIYMAQKERKKRNKRGRLVNFKPSLTRRRIELLSNANDKIKDNDSVKFDYADLHGTLKIVLQNPLKRKFVYSFNTEIELDKILSKLDPQYQESRASDVEK